MNGLETVGASGVNETAPDDSPLPWQVLLAASRTGLPDADGQAQERFVESLAESLVAAVGREISVHAREELEETLRFFLINETFSFTDGDGTQYLWNVTEGMKFVASSFRAVETFYPGANGVTATQIREMYSGLDEEKAKRADLSVPVLFIPFKGRHLLIDGWHRMYRAVSEGRESVPAYVLTQREADAILVRQERPQTKEKEGGSTA